ncbi:tetratricopeptide repeat protein [Planomonospora sp. ID91781]|uniref:tetratricopeptide repeat protein n=1 Tax=Planomonospora sp. ID91781 TaxID=2738135 RepID=UPI0018C3E113|nr:tetratricopeptide repeat protein [Planomonospora sp. ID91781]MBG0823339.1 tetratricopeptide repeat protein [Planomonospora sp. ID91781]
MDEHPAHLLQQRLEAVRERLSPAHPDTLAAWHDLAEHLGEAGDPRRARDLFTDLVPICERVHGAEHPDTLTARHELAYWKRRARWRL